MNCVRCGSLLQVGQAQCSCGQYVDLPASEFYTRLENQVEKSSRDSFRRGLLIGLGFLFLFLLLETIMDRSDRRNAHAASTLTCPRANSILAWRTRLKRVLGTASGGVCSSALAFCSYFYYWKQSWTPFLLLGTSSWVPFL